MYILDQERPQNVNYTNKVLNFQQTLDGVDLCIKCKHSDPNPSYPKDEMDCKKTGGICNALCVCDLFEGDW